MYSKDFMKYLVCYQDTENTKSSKKEKEKYHKSAKSYSGKLATILLTCSK